MQSIINNSIFKKYLLAIFVVCALFSPLSFSVKTATFGEAKTYAQTTPTPTTPSSLTTPNPPASEAQKRAEGSAAQVRAQAESTGWGIVDAVIKWIGTAFLAVASAFTWMGGMLFDFAFTKLVFGMSGQINGQSLGGAIDNTWKIIRDICNLAFIFGFIYIGIRTILDPENSSTKRMLAQVIIGALLINFSLFFTKIVIDFSNFTAIQIYNAMTTGSGSISASMANALGIITFYGTPAPDALNEMSSNLWFFIMAGAFLLIAAFVFIAGAILLIIRFVALILIMVASPILFAGAVFPGTQSFASDLWKKLISYSFFAPIYLLMILISLLLLSKMQFTGSGDSFVQAFNRGTFGNDSFTIFLQFFIAIFFLISSLTIASKLGIQGGQMAINIGNNIRGSAQSFIGRNTVGRASANLLDKYEKFDAKNKDNGGWKFARTMMGGDRILRNSIGAGKKAKFGGSYSRQDDKDYDKEQKTRQIRINNLSKIDDAAGVFVNAPATSDKDETQKAFYKTVRDASQTQLLETIKELKPEDAKYKAVVHAMTNAQFDKLMEEKDENFDDDKKSEARKSREESFKSIEGDTDATRRELHKDFRKAKDAAKISTKVLMDSAATQHITPDIFHSMIDQKVDIATQRKVYENLVALGDQLDETMRQYLDSPYVQQRFGVSQSSGTKVPHKSFKQKLKEAGKI